MHQPPALALTDDLGDAPRAEGRGERHVAAGEGLADTHHIRAHASVLACEQRARAPEAGGDLIEHQQQPVLVAQPPQQRHALGGVKAHAARSLHDGLDDDRRQLPA